MARASVLREGRILPPLHGAFWQLSPARLVQRSLRYALAWRERLVRDLDGPRQLRLGVLP
jgi:hypothetical protein